MKNKQKKPTVTLPATKIIESKKAKIAQMAWDGSLMYLSKFRGKTIKNDDGLITLTNEGKLNSFIIDAKTGKGSVMADVNLSELKKLVKKAERMKKYWAKVNKERRSKKQMLIQSSLIHLNPELTFSVRYDK